MSERILNIHTYLLSNEFVTRNKSGTKHHQRQKDGPKLKFSRLEKMSVWTTCSKANTSWKEPDYGVFSGPYFPTFVLNTEIYRVNLCIQSESGKIRNRKNSVFVLVNADLKHLVNWLNANKISLNVKKIEMVIFKSNQKKFEGDLKIKLCGKRLYPTKSVEVARVV